ncbi:LysM peptidoglycan-binding domain-containing protein [Bacillus mangrovi]|uniref:LysM peptidoglycan-binding domain-containing protein n=1 Tax=Metabacillus mangrovi TaxID=1491830 RepID=A0A7X2S2J1_9BACI|nr:LysM peptidoglycan-binding domain-containing protein [Metabacillus mangrovi]MTH52207.1 LysM peptidoglycan-binding domain-containing protein [Metabacillus mangrovi]
MNKQTTPPDHAEKSRLQRRAERKEAGTYPSRSEIHKNKRQEKEDGKKIKLKYPLISLLALCFILLPIFLLSFTYYYGKNGTTLDDGQKLKDYESIIIDNNREDEIQQEDLPPEESSSNSEQDTKGDSAGTSSEEKDDENRIAMEQQKQKEETRRQEAEEKKLKQQQEEKEAQQKLAQEQKEAQQKREEQQREAEKKAAEEQKPESKQKPDSAAKVVKHIVKPEENLFRISLKYYKSREGEAIIKEYNHLQENEVYTGQVLEIPLRQ